MKRAAIAIAAAVGLSICLASARAEPVDAARLNKLMAELPSPATCPGAINPSVEALETPAFAALPSTQQFWFLQLLIDCSAGAQAADAAIAAVKKGDALGAPWGPKVRLNLTIKFKRPSEEILASFENLARRRPSDIPSRTNYVIWTVIAAAQRTDPTGVRELSVHETLLANGFHYEDRLSDDYLRVAHARVLMDNGQIERARERLSTVTEPRLLLGISLMKLFDPLRTDPAFERRLDFRAAAEANLAQSQEEMAAAPDELRLVVQTSEALRTLGRDEEALRLMESALSRLRTFKDRRENENWAVEQRANALRALGRSDKARRASRRAAKAEENGGDNVSQAINYAGELEADEKPREALAMLENLGDTSPYGDMWVAATRACAYEQLRDTVRRDEALAYLAANEVENPAARARALLCADKQDDVAQLYIRRLANSAQRMDALLALQTYPAAAEPGRTRRALILSRMAAVTARADVRAAVLSVGRFEPALLTNMNWGEI